MTFEIIKVKEGFYRVQSDSGETYHVDVDAGSCTCPHTFYNKGSCKHLRDVMRFLGKDPIEDIWDKVKPRVNEIFGE